MEKPRRAAFPCRLHSGKWKYLLLPPILCFCPLPSSLTLIVGHRHDDNHEIVLPRCGIDLSTCYRKHWQTWPTDSPLPRFSLLRFLWSKTSFNDFLSRTEKVRLYGDRRVYGWFLEIGFQVWDCCIGRLVKQRCRSFEGTRVSLVMDLEKRERAARKIRLLFACVWEKGISNGMIWRCSSPANQMLTRKELFNSTFFVRCFYLHQMVARSRIAFSCNKLLPRHWFYRMQDERERVEYSFAQKLLRFDRYLFVFKKQEFPFSMEKFERVLAGNRGSRERSFSGCKFLRGSLFFYLYKITPRSRIAFSSNKLFPGLF